MSVTRVPCIMCSWNAAHYFCANIPCLMCSFVCSTLWLVNIDVFYVWVLQSIVCVYRHNTLVMVWGAQQYRKWYDSHILHSSMSAMHTMVWQQPTHNTLVLVRLRWHRSRPLPSVRGAQDGSWYDYCPPCWWHTRMLRKLTKAPQHSWEPSNKK